MRRRLSEIAMIAALTMSALAPMTTDALASSHADAGAPHAPAERRSRPTGFVVVTSLTTGALVVVASRKRETL